MNMLFGSLANPQGMQTNKLLNMLIDAQKPEGLGRAEAWLESLAALQQLCRWRNSYMILFKTIKTRSSKMNG